MVVPIIHITSATTDVANTSKPVDLTLVDIDARFREELRTDPLPSRISLVGTVSMVAIATRLLAIHAPRIIIADDGVPVRLMSLEAFGASFLASFLEEKNPPSWPVLLYSIPEATLACYAKKQGLPAFSGVALDSLVIDDNTRDVRLMLDHIAISQPQTYHSLCRSALRLRERTEKLRVDERN